MNKWIDSLRFDFLKLYLKTRPRSNNPHVLHRHTRRLKVKVLENISQEEADREGRYDKIRIRKKKIKGKSIKPNQEQYLM